MLAEEGAALEEAEPLGGLALACYPETDQQMAGALRGKAGRARGTGAQRPVPAAGYPDHRTLIPHTPGGQKPTAKVPTGGFHSEASSPGL